MSVKNLIPEYMQKKYFGLKMKPEDWTLLNSILNDENYRVAVLEYQAEEFEALPRCTTIFGLCTHYDHGRCTMKDFCSQKV